MGVLWDKMAQGLSAAVDLKLVYRYTSTGALYWLVIISNVVEFTILQGGEATMWWWIGTVVVWLFSAA